MVYGMQRKTFAVVLYILLALGIVSQLASLILQSALIRGIMPGLENHLIPSITDKIQFGLTNGEPVILIFGEYLIYVAIVLALSVFAFHKKEVEF